MILFCFAGQIEDIWSPQMRVKKNHHQKGSLQGKIRQNGQNLLCYNLLCYQGLFLNKRNIHAHNCAQNAKCYKIFFLWIERCNRQPGTLHLHSLLCRVHVRLVWWKAHLLKQVVTILHIPWLFTSLIRIYISVGNNLINKRCIILCKMVLFWIMCSV